MVVDCFHSCQKAVLKKYVEIDLIHPLLQIRLSIPNNYNSSVFSILNFGFPNLPTNICSCKTLKWVLYSHPFALPLTSALAGWWHWLLWWQPPNHMVDMIWSSQAEGAIWGFISLSDSNHCRQVPTGQGECGSGSSWSKNFGKRGVWRGHGTSLSVGLELILANHEVSQKEKTLLCRSLGKSMPAY